MPAPCVASGQSPERGLSSPTAVQLPSAASLWYLGLASRPAPAATDTDTAADSQTASGTVPAADRETITSASRETVTSASSQTVSAADSRTATAADSRTATSADSQTVISASSRTVSAADSRPATSADSRTVSAADSGTSAATSSSAAASATVPVRPAAPVSPDSVSSPAGPVPAESEPLDSEPLDALSSLRVSFAAEHDRLMAGLQLAAGVSVAVSQPRQALQCFRTAAALGSAPAWFNCGVCFQEGRGTDVDLEKVGARRGSHFAAVLGKRCSHQQG